MTLAQIRRVSNAYKLLNWGNVCRSTCDAVASGTAVLAVAGDAPF